MPALTAVSGGYLISASFLLIYPLLHKDGVVLNHSIPEEAPVPAQPAE
jgi:hypothetical protein